MVVLTADSGAVEGDKLRVGVARVPVWAGAQVNTNQTAVPAFPGQPTRDFGRA